MPQKSKMLYDWVKNKVCYMFLFVTSRDSGMPFLDLRLDLSRVPSLDSRMHLTTTKSSLYGNQVCFASQYQPPAN